MPSKFSIYDSAGNVRPVTKFSIYDNVSNRLNVSKAWIYDSAGNRREFFSGAGGFSLVAGNASGLSTGYQEGVAGTPTPNPPYLNGVLVTMLLSSNSVNQIRLQMFSPTNPGQALFNQLTVAPLWFGSSASATYSYAGSTATWDWVTTSKLVVGSNYTVSVT